MEDRKKVLFNREYLNRWYSNYNKLEEYCKNKKIGRVKMDVELASWAENQRQIMHLLPPELKSKLSNLDFDFEGDKSSWDSMFRELSSFVQLNGHAYVPAEQEHEALRDWLIRQIINRRLLTENQFQKLDKLNVDWEMTFSRDQRWELMFLRLRDFHQTFGHSRVPQKWRNDPQLALWVQVQRRMYTQGKLREDREKKLRELDFVWNIKTVFDSQWRKHFEELASFHKKHGHTRVPGKYPKLVGWMERQRSAKANGSLSPKREKMLNDIGFIWDFKTIKKKDWEEKYQQLYAYQQEHGDSFVPVNYKENKSLGTWVATQRWLEAKGKLGQAKRKKLDDLGFVWSRDTESRLKAINTDKWEASFKKLEAYYHQYGTCQVSLKKDRVLQRWTCWQRKAFYEGKLSQDRMDRLNEIRFPWSIQEGYWMKMYDALIGFKKQFGHTRVPFQWKVNHKLADWVYRTKVNKSKLSVQKVELLDKIGFDWALSRKNVVPWKEMYSRLLTFLRKHGHTRVPVKYKEDPKLGKWASRMRSERESLEPRRVALLEAIEFDWGYKFSRKTASSSHQEFVQEDRGANNADLVEK